MLDAVFLTHTVHIRYFRLGNTTEIQVDLFWFETGRHPGIFLEGTSRVVVRMGRLSVVRGGRRSEMGGHFVDDPLTLRHVGDPRRALVLLARALAVSAHFPLRKE